MSRDKQIEDMARTMCNCYDSGYCKMHGNSCDLKCISGFNALGLCNAGYRKSTDLARKIFEEIEEALAQNKEIADIRIRELAPHTYQVMREVGKLYCKHASRAIAELKKKYTQEITEGEG